jgi:DNA invertase Pin-like site-specific DNA recombinase
MRFVTYYRVSTKRQGDSGLGLDAQKRDIQIYLDNYADVPYEIMGTFTDIASGKENGRDELTRAIELAKSSKSILLVAKLDRLSRKVSFVAGLLEDKHLEFKVAQMPHADKFQLHIYAALAEQEREFISKRTKAALAEAKARGVKLGGLRDKTNARNKQSALLARERAEKLRNIIEPLLLANCSYREIARSLNKVGLKTSSGGDFHAATILRVVERLSL